MASKKKLLQAAAGSAGGGATTDVDDVFSTFLYDGTGATQVIENGIALGNDGDGGSILLEAQADGLEITQSSDFNFGTGDFTCEAWVWLNDTNTTYRTMLGFDVTLGLLFQVVNMKLDLGLRGTSATSSTSSLTANQWNHLAAVRSSGTVYLFINGTLDRTATTDSSGTSWSTRNLSNSTNALIGDYSKTATNFNGRISNLRVSTTARYTSTFTVPTSALSSDANTVLLIGQNDDPFSDQSSNSHSATPYGSPSKSNFGPFTGTSGEGGLVWIKNRTGENHGLVDTEVNGLLFSNLTNAANTGITHTFNSNGFTVGSSGSMNDSPDAHVSWTFRKAPKFFDVVTYTGDDSGNVVKSHSLGSTPGMIIIKNLSSNTGWDVFHRSTTNGLGTGRLFLHSTNAEDNTSTQFLTADSSSITLTHSIVKTGGENYVAYLFAHNNSDGEFGPDADQDIIKCGSFTTNSSGEIPDVNLGFEPQFVLMKAAGANTSWFMMDTMRGYTLTGTQPLEANSSNAETTSWGANTYLGVPTSTGFTQGSSNTGTNNTEWIYMAIRRGPLAEPESATDVFAIDGNTSRSNPPTSGFVNDMILTKTPSYTWNWDIGARLMGDKFLRTAQNSSESSTSTLVWDSMTSVYDVNRTDYQAWMWKRAPSYFDVVAYSGTGSARTQSHNLNAVPEMMWVRPRNLAENWAVYHKDVGATKYLQLNSTNAAATSSTRWNDTTPTSSVFSLGADNEVNASGYNYIAYLFATVAGVSKVGSFVADGNAQNIDCGFSSGARFVLIKKSSGTFDWRVWDSTRGIVAGDDPYLFLNSTAAEATNGDWIDPYSSGFSITSAFSNGTYIFYAIA